VGFTLKGLFSKRSLEKKFAGQRLWEARVGHKPVDVRSFDEV